MSIVVFIPEQPRELARYRWAALNGSQPGPLQAGVAGVPPGADAVLVAPSNAVRLTSARLPAKNRRRLTQLAFAVEDELAADAASLHAVAGSELADGLNAVALCEREWMEQALAAVRGAGLVPVSMRVETLLPPLDVGAWVAVWNGAGGFVRTGVATGLGYDADPAGGAPLALRLAMGEAKFLPKQIVVRSIATARAPDLAAWSVALGVPVAGGALWPGLEAGWDKSIELMSGEFAPRSRLGSLPELARALRPALAIAVLIVVAQFVLTGAEWIKLKSEQRRLQTQMVSDFKAAFPGAQQVDYPALQMRRNLAGLRGASGMTDEADFLALAARAAPALAGSRIKLMKYDKERLEVDAVYPSAQALERAQRTLGANAVVSQPAGNDGGIDAHIVLTAEGA
jgi:type II secretion system protein L